MQWNVFISYSRKDDAVFSFEKQSTNEGWVTRFRQDLEKAIPMMTGHTVKVWHDKRLDGNEYFKDTIAEATANSSMLLPIISPSYREDINGWLTRERENFVKAAVMRGGLRLGNKSRICPVLLGRVEIKDLPSEIKDLNLSHEFYDPEGHPLRGPDYENRLRDVAKNIGEMLKVLGADGPSVITPHANSPQTVYLARSKELDLHRDEIEEELRSLGYSVLPAKDTKFPDKYEDLKQIISNDLKICCMSIHLVGKVYGGTPEDDRRSVVQIQIEAAQFEKRARVSDFTQIVWTPPEIDPIKTMIAMEAGTDAIATSFFKQFEQVDGSFEYLRDHIETLKAHVITSLNSLKKTAGRPRSLLVEQLPDYVMPKVYVVCDASDRHLVQPLEELLEKRNWWAELPPDTTDQKAFRELHEQNLKDCQAVVIFYGSAPSTWVDEQRLSFRRASLTEPKRVAPLFSKWIYVGPVENEQKMTYHKKEDYQIYRNFGPISSDFVDRIAPRHFLSIGTSA